jgi:hypothetical protein
MGGAWAALKPPLRRGHWTLLEEVPFTGSPSNGRPKRCPNGDVILIIALILIRGVCVKSSFDPAFFLTGIFAGDNIPDNLTSFKGGAYEKSCDIFNHAASGLTRFGPGLF